MIYPSHRHPERCPAVRRDIWRDLAFSLARYVGLVLALVIGVCGQQAPAPKISRIEPPNWWIGLPNPMIMFTGENLENAQLSIAARGVHVRRTQSGRNGHYLFAWLDIDKKASPGQVSLSVTTPGGKQTAEWKLEKRN